MARSPADSLYNVVVRDLCLPQTNGFSQATYDGKKSVNRVLMENERLLYSADIV